MPQINFILFKNHLHNNLGTFLYTFLLSVRRRNIHNDQETVQFIQHHPVETN